MTRRTAALRLIALVALVGVAVLIAVAIGIPDQAQLRSRFAGLGPAAPVLFAAVYAVATLSPLPKSVLTLAAGAIFGLAEGLLVVMTGAIGGAIMAFYLARAIGRSGVQRLIGVRIGRLDEQVARHAFRTVLVARLVPVVPFTVVNYLAGLTAIRAPVFLAATALGMLPATSAYVALGAYGSEPGSWPFWVAVGALAALTAGGAVARVRQRRRVQRRLRREDSARAVSETPIDGGPRPARP